MPFRLLRICAIALVGTLVGCLGLPSVPISAADRNAIKSVNVVQVEVPPDLFFHGLAQSFAALGGAVGGLAGQEAAKGPKAQLLSVIKANGIELEQILRQEFAKAADSRGGMKVAEGAAGADGQVSLKVNRYGFAKDLGVNSMLYPVLNVTVTLKKADGTVAWQDTEFAGALAKENDQGYTFEQYIKDPQLIRQAFTKISAIVSRLLIADFYGAK